MGFDGRIARLVLVGAAGPIVMAQGAAEGVTPDMLDALCAQLATDLPAGSTTTAPGTSQRVIEWLASMVLDCSRRAAVGFQRTIAKADFSAEAASLTLPVTAS